jgi:hypothetical protein
VRSLSYRVERLFGVTSLAPVIETNRSNGKAKLFLSCGQNPKYDEYRWGEKVAEALGPGPSGVGFDVFFAPRVQDSKSLTQVIFRELEDSDYYVLIDFKREELVPPFKVDTVQHLGRCFLIKNLL